MKKAISVLLSVLIITASAAAGLTALASDDGLRIAVASDLHYLHTGEELEGNIDDEIYWYANRRAAMETESGFIIDSFLAQCAADESCDYVLISGDLADSGKKYIEDHETVAAKLRAFEQATGKDVFVINGNHDAGNWGTSLEDFKRIYAEFGYDKAITEPRSDCSYAADLGSKYRLIALDSCDPDASTADGMSAEKLEWVHAQAKAAKADGRYPILMMHHNLLDHMPLQRIFSKNFIVRFHNTTAELFADWGIRMVLSGHEHCSDATVYTSALGNKIYDFATTSLTMYPLQYRIIDFTDERISYAAETVRSIDTAALSAAVKGYSERQLALMNEDLSSYALGFLKAGVQYRLALSLTMEKMGISEDDFYYDLVKTAVTRMTDILEMPLYGEGSVQQLAAEYNIEIPDSDYENGWDLATDLVAAHYAGEESKTLDSPEVTILLRTVALILKDVPSTVNDEVLLKSANDLLSKIGIDSISGDLSRLTAKVFGAVTPGKYFIVALISPILYEFAFDSDGVNDNNGSIEGCGASQSAPQNEMANVNRILGMVSLYFSFFICYMLKMIGLK